MNETTTIETKAAQDIEVLADLESLVSPDLLGAVIAQSGVPMSEPARARLVSEVAARRDALAAVARLTGREREILTLLCNGMNQEDLAEHMRMARNTMHTCTNTIRRKLEVDSTIEAAVIAARAGLV